MKEHKKETREYESVSKITCDLCGASSDGSDWGNFPYTRREVNVSHTDGSCDPDGGGYGISYEVDLCPQCFKEKLIPWLKSQGCDVKGEEYIH